MMFNYSTHYVACNRTRQIRLAVTVIVGSLLLNACVTSHVEMSFKNTMKTSEKDGVVLLTRKNNAQSETADSFVECVKSKLARGANGIELKHEQIFLDSLFPWFEPRIAPLNANSLPDLLGKPGVAQKVADSGVRYVMWLGGSVETTDGGGSLSCNTSMGCFGFTWWENGATFKASIWDLKKQVQTGVISADVKGRSFLPAIVVPIPLIAPTRSTACDSLANQLKKQLVSS